MQPAVFDGKGASAATTTPTTIEIGDADKNKNLVAKRLSVQHLSGAGNLLVGLNDEPDITIKPNQSFDIDADISKFTVTASADTVEWEAVATVE